MNNITNSISGNSEIIKIYEWSIRKVMFRHARRYRTYLIGYVPSCNKLEITTVKRVYLKQRLISGDHTDDIYSLCGSPGLDAEAEDIWCNYKKFVRIIHEKDISHKFKDLNDELYHNKLIEQYGLNYYMYP